MQQVLKDLERACANFFARRAGFPNFRRKGVCERFRYPDPKKVRLDQGNGRVFLPKLGWLRYRKSRVRKIHGRIGNARRDFLHKASTAICKNHAVVFVEDLKVGNLSRSAARTVDAPGRNVRAKTGLNKAILDQGWFGFRRLLEYKLQWNGGQLVAVPPRNTSRTCPDCGHVSKENRRTQARFACVQCGYAENADRVGAINILRAGLARSACEVSGASMPPAAGTRRSDPFERHA